MPAAPSGVLECQPSSPAAQQPGGPRESVTDARAFDGILVSIEDDARPNHAGTRCMPGATVPAIQRTGGLT